MHELSIAAGLVEKLIAFSAKNEGKKIVEVRLEIGELSHVDPDALSFCYEAITRETPLQESRLTIERTPAVVSCPYCSYSGRPESWDDVRLVAPVVTMRCPKCGETVAADQGRECAIKSVKFIETKPTQSS